MAPPCNPEIAKEIIERFISGVDCKFEEMQSPFPIFVREEEKGDFIVFKIGNAVKPNNGE